MSISFTVNKKVCKVNLADYPPDITLNTFLREHAQFPGTKFMCLEGGCGVCICAITGRHPASKKIHTWATNSCLTLLNVCDGWDITTIEGIGNKKDGYHPIQERLAHMNGTQCGYCSPAMVMNMYSLMQAKGGKVSMEEVENSFGGNICRCTGYRPILDAMKSFATDCDFKYMQPCRDIEDVGIKCPKTGTMCSGVCKPRKLHVAFDDGSQWFKANSLKDIFDAFKEIGDKKYMLVAGNTAHGVYRRSPDVRIFIDVNQVPDLHAFALGNLIELGGNMSLTETMDILTEASKTPGFEYCKEIVHHIDLIANVPVRNMGTLAGNLSIKHERNEFPSDLFLTLEAAGAQVVVLESETKPITVSVLNYLKLSMKHKVLVCIKLSPKPKNEYLFNSYKIMPRAQNAHAYVNASFMTQIKNGKVVSARICFGGINPEFVHAKATEDFLVGKELFNNQTIQAALMKLNAELEPDWELPDASPDYRKILACGLFYKYILGFAPDEKTKREYRSGGDILRRPLSSGTQTFDTQKQNYPLTEPIPKLEALIQCSGEAFYMNDLPHQPGELWAAFVHATEATAKIAQIDPSEALKIPGVVAFYSAKDIPGKNTFVSTTIIAIMEEEEIFCSDQLKYYAQPIGVIVAESLDLAKKASEKVKVMYERTNQKVMPTLADIFESKASNRIKDVLRSGGPIHAPTNVYGTKKLESFFDLGSQYHYTMEPQTTICIPNDTGMLVYSATQSTDFTQLAISEALNIPQNRIHLETKRVGGGYGAKISRVGQIAAACAIAAHHLNRPVRFVQSIESMMSSLGKRMPCHVNYQVEVDNYGKIMKLVSHFASDVGCTINESPLQFLTLVCFKNIYTSGDHWTVNGKEVITDAPSHTWCRAPGAIEGVAAIENIMEHIARVTGKDPVDVRMANIAEGEKMRTLLTEFLDLSEYRDRKRDITQFNRENRWRKKGIAIGLMRYPIHYFGSFPATVAIYHGDGSVAISHGGVEMGQGINTKVAQVAAFTLGIPLDKVSIRPTDSFSGANSTVTGAGIASESVCYATRKACETLLERIKPIREKVPSGKWEDIINKCYSENVNLLASDMYKAGDLEMYDVFGLCCTEVEIDILTGNLLVTRVDLLEDTGESLSPMVDIGQIEGAFMMGLGYWLTEQLVFNRINGELLTTRTWTYKPPGAKDVPIDFRITLLQKSPNPAGFLRSKTTGEPAAALACTAMLAVRHAIESARDDAGVQEKWFHLGAPTTSETIGLAASSSIEMFKLL